MSKPGAFSDGVKNIIFGRANGWCERCPDGHGVEHHHRRPRAAGGSRRPDTNSVANGVLLCAACHRDVESHRTKAYMEGWLLRQHQNPLEIPVLMRGRWVLLDNAGGVSVCPEGYVA